MITLESLGWGEPFLSDFSARGIPGGVPGRVIEEQRGAYIVYTEVGELLTEISGKMRHEAKRREDFPTVGDWVVVKARPKEKTGSLLAILKRTTKLSRKASGQETDEQLIAANLNTVFIVSSLNRDFNERRLERYLALVSDCGAAPVVLLSKADLYADPAAVVRSIQATTLNVPVHVLSTVTNQGINELSPYLRVGETVALIGSSGVGKSTLINRLLGWDRQVVQAVRKGDDRGRHTTTFRRLVPLPQGGMLIDTPGMRELQIWDTQGVSDAFPDILVLIDACRFRDCRHHTDAGCAVQAAIAEGRLTLDRFQHYGKLKQESESLTWLRDREADLKANEKIKQVKAAYKKERKR